MRKTNTSRSRGLFEPDGQAAITCKLFSDHVSEALCGLRRKELDRKGGFLCEGCPRDAVFHGHVPSDGTNPVVPADRARDRQAREH